jgi:Zn-dependent protease/CBS domain-containing protein
MGGYRLGRICGIPIEVHPSWFLALIGSTATLALGLFPSMWGFKPAASWALGFAGSLLLFGSVLAHEAAHAVVARRCGVGVGAIALFFLGGAAQLDEEPPTPGCEFRIAGAGPLASLLLAAACLPLIALIPAQRAWHPAAALACYTGGINLALALFNLVPAYPLDGGRLLRATLWKMTGDPAAALRVSTRLGEVFGWGLAIYALCFRFLPSHDWSALWEGAAGGFIALSARAARWRMMTQRALDTVSVASVLTYDLPGIDADLPLSIFAAQYLMQSPHPFYPVSADGEFVGVIHTEEVRQLSDARRSALRVRALVRRPHADEVVRPDETAWDALQRMWERDGSRVLVLARGRLIGTVAGEALRRLVRARTGLRLPA